MSELRSATAILADVRRRRVALPSGIEIALVDFGGEGPLALLHHANGFCAGVWGLVADGLRRGFRVVAMDARGHGDSSKPEQPEAYRWACFTEDLLGVAGILARERAATGGAARVALGVGHSFGGTAMLMAASQRPELFERIALVDPVIPPPEARHVSPERRAHVGRLAGAARERNPVFASREAAQRSWAEKRFFSAWRPEALALYAAEGLRDRPDGQVELKCPGEAEAAIFEASGGLDVFGTAAGMTTPALFLWARRGDFPRAVYEKLASSMTRARVEDVDAGHLAPMERPDLVLEAVLRFVAES
jgi:pimeloyl-ACP methyl ester carboxylesterase